MTFPASRFYDYVRYYPLWIIRCPNDNAQEFILVPRTADVPYPVRDDPPTYMNFSR